MAASNTLLKISSHTDFLCDLLPFPSSLAGPRRCPAILLRASLSPALPQAHSRCTADPPVSRPPLTAAATATLSGTIPGHLGRQRS